MRAVAYARYSSDLQAPSSIEDQIRVCCERVEREGWTYLHAYCDRAMSGTSQLRPGYQTGGSWGPSTIIGNTSRGTGIQQRALHR
jgi:hypothetical protein